VTVAKQEEKGIINNQQDSWKFKFDKILDNISQEDVFDICGRDIVRNVIDGYNATIMAYGQTGAGKTFTMSGTMNNYKYRGIIPRAISLIFQEIASRFDQAVTIKISFCEIYNELVSLFKPLFIPYFSYLTYFLMSQLMSNLGLILQYRMTQEVEFA
jgi:kinesin family protein 6/9